MANLLGIVKPDILDKKNIGKSVSDKFAIAQKLIYNKFNL